MPSECCTNAVLTHFAVPKERILETAWPREIGDLPFIANLLALSP
jgi:hypothetical protein